VVGIWRHRTIAPEAVPAEETEAQTTDLTKLSTEARRDIG
jgi:hypothetical protein